MKRRDLIFIIFVILVIIFISGKFFLFNDQNNFSEIREEIIQKETFIPETLSQAKLRQIVTLYDEVSPSTLGDLKSEKLCEINFEKNEISSDEEAKGTFIFDKSLWGKKVYLACDQFERYGITEDELQEVQAGSSEEKLNCDYGRVTTPTIYFYSASNKEDTDYCIAPIIVNPLEGDEGGCFDNTTIAEMKSECEKNDKPSFEIPDSNGCTTIYCGWDYNLCPSEELLEKSEAECKSEENRVAMRYSEEVANYDFPCAQVRCSQCPSEVEIEEEGNNCIERGGIPDQKFDYDTGCEFVFCGTKKEPILEPIA